MKYLTFVVSLGLLLLSPFVNCQNLLTLESDPTFSLQASWTKTPFKLNVLEAIADVDASLYEILVLKLLGIEYDDDSEEYNIIEGFDELDDTEFYTYAKTLLNSHSKSFLADMKIANVLMSPRIQAQFSYYNGAIKSKHNCNQDAVIFEPIGTNIYCDKDAAFMLQNHNEKMIFSDHSMSFDRMLGSQPTAKTYFIYGDFRDEYFRVMFFNMYQFVHSKKINLVWRYVDTHPSPDRELLSGYIVNVLSEEKYDSSSKDFRQHIINQLLEMESSIIHKVAPDSLQNYINTGVFNTTDSNALSHIDNSIYINDAKVEDYDFLKLIETIGSEIAAQEVIRMTGVDLKDSIKSIKKLMDVSPQQFEHRYQIFKSPAVAFLNDIENDTRYSNFSLNESLYQEEFVTDEIPKMKQNIHQVVFIIDITQPDQINKLLDFYDIVFNNYLPIQVGVIPVIDTDRNGNMKGIGKLYGTHNNLGRSKTHSYLLMLQRFLQSYQRVFERIFDEIMFPDASEETLEIMLSELQHINESYGLNAENPQVNVNGIFYDLDDFESIFQQIKNDSYYLYASLIENKIPHPIKLKTYLRRDSVSVRDGNVFPSNSKVLKSQIMFPPDLEKYKKWTESGLLKITRPQHDHETPITFNLIGSFENKNFVEQVKEALVFAKGFSGITLTIFDSSFSDEFKHLKTVTQLEEQLHYLQNQSIEISDSNHDIPEYLKPFNINDEHINSYIVVSGRKIQLSNVLKASQLTSLAHHERLHRLHPLWEKYRINSHLAKENNVYNNFELYSWAISYSSYLLKSRNECQLNKKEDIHINSDTEFINVKLFTDLVSTNSQELFHIIELMKDLKFVSIDIYFVSPPKYEQIPLKWSKAFVNMDPMKANNMIKFHDLPQTYDIDVKTPSSWIISTIPSDLNNITYELKYITVDVYLKDYKGNPMIDIPIELIVDHQNSEAYFSIPEDGYLQIKTKPGQWNLGIQYGSNSDILYKLEENKFETIGFEPRIQYIDLVEKEHFVDISFDSLQSNAPFLERIYFRAQQLLHKKQVKNSADVNIFTVPQGFQEQERMLVMIASVMKNTRSTVKFWIYDGFLSSTIKIDVEILSKRFGFDFEYIEYQWPVWLPKPENKEQQSWGIQNLFLDSVFPTSIEKVVIISPNQIIRDDVIKLNDVISEEKAMALSFISLSDVPESLHRGENLKQILNSQNGIYVDNLAIVNLNTFRDEGLGAEIRNKFVITSSSASNDASIDYVKQFYEGINIQQIPSQWLWCNGISKIDLYNQSKSVGFCSELTKDSRFSDEIKERQDLLKEILMVLDEVTPLTDVINHDEL